jgi:DNA ligase (NAD+)
MESPSNVINFLDKCQEAYYNGTPLISDAEFDALAERFGYSEVGAKPTSKNKKHLYPMYSLQKVYAEDNPTFPSTSLVKTPKLDGAAISILYIDGILTLAITRGDGTVGEDITDKMYASNIVPLSIPKYGVLQVTGEVLASKEIENARNYANGALHLKDIDEFLTRKIIFAAYGVYPFITDSYMADMGELKAFGFNVVTYGSWDDYPQDGTVVRIESNSAFEGMGYTAKHPKGAWAVKRRSDVEVLETELLDVVWQLGKGGKVTPVAILETVNIGGADISRATLHNAGFVENLDLSIGDTLLITRSGGIIPKVVGKV